MMQRRNNYARADVVILYRLYMWMGNMYAHNNSVQRVDSSERTVVMCIYKVSYRIGFFIEMTINRLQIYENRTKPFCVDGRKMRKICLNWHKMPIYQG